MVLLHGLNRTDGSMDAVARALTGAGMTVVNVDYPSAAFPMSELAGRVLATLREC